jgi:electron transfer flavoprotein beta subunit
MHVVVCVKQIPDPTLPGVLQPSTMTLDRSGKLALDEADSYGVEMGLQLVDAAGEGEVTLLSMVPGFETSGLRQALAMGAARALVVSDPALGGSDALSTAKVLAAALAATEFDLVIAATESTDGYTGTMPVQLAELLGLPSVTFAKAVRVVDAVLEVERQTESGYDEVSCPLPAVVTVTAGVVEPRYPSFKGIMAAKSKPIEELDLAALSIDPATVGVSGSRQRVLDVAGAATRAAGEIVVDDGSAQDKIVAFLEAAKVI